MYFALIDIDLNKSVFDYFEAKRGEPFCFSWQPRHESVSVSHCLYSGNLITIEKSTNVRRVEFYQLTAKALIRTRDEDSASPVEATSTLALRNPRVVRVARPSLKLYVGRDARHGFLLESCGDAFEFYCRRAEEREEWIGRLSRVAVLVNVRGKYEVGKKLGKGNFGKVSLGVRRSDGKKFAIKSINKTKLRRKERSVRNLINEINVLRLMDHPKIMKLYEVYESEEHIHLVTEYIQNENLLFHLRARGSYSEKDASQLVTQALEILAYCHSLGVVHRDLKPDNFMINFSTEGPELKLIDFGLSATLGAGKVATLMCGTPGYIAPEVFAGTGYSCKADLFSLGIVLFIV